jgi:hypothetical protein
VLHARNGGTYGVRAVSTEPHRVEPFSLEDVLVGGKRRKNRNEVKPKVQCAHCGRMVSPDHQCWVITRKVSCHTCGKPNHIALTCSEKKAGVEVNMTSEPSIDELEKQLEQARSKLQKARSKKRVRFSNDNDEVLVKEEFDPTPSVERASRVSRAKQDFRKGRKTRPTR